MTFSHTQKQEGLYADGNLVFSQQLPSVGQTVGGGAWTVGDYGGGGADVTTGPDVDEVQVYSRVLSGAEISAIFAAGRHGVCKPYSCNSAASVPATPRSVLFFLATAMLLLFTYWLPRKHERSSNAAHYG